MSPDKLVYMANQIGTFFKSQPGVDQAERIALHLRDYWEPRMRSQLFELADLDTHGLDPLVMKATDRLKLMSEVLPVPEGGAEAP